MRMMGRVKHEVLYNQAAEVPGRFCEGDPEYISEKLKDMQSGAYRHVPCTGCRCGRAAENG